VKNNCQKLIVVVLFVNKLIRANAMTTKEELMQFVEEWALDVECVLSSGIGLFEQEEKRFLKQLSVCTELYANGAWDLAKMNTVDLGYFCIDVLKLQNLVENHLGGSAAYEWKHSQLIKNIVIKSLGYALVEHGEDYGDSYAEVGSEYFDEAFAAISGMKLTSYLAATKLLPEQFEFFSRIEFAKSRRGYSPVTFFHSTHSIEDYAYTSSMSTETLGLELISRARYREREMVLKNAFGASTFDELCCSLVDPANATTVSHVLSLNMPMFISTLEKAIKKDQDLKIKQLFKGVSEIPPKIRNIDLVNDQSIIDSNEFISLVAKSADIHESFRGNKKLIVYTLESGIDIGIEQAAKKVRIWIAKRFISSELECFIKHVYPATIKDNDKYGRHSGLRLYDQLAWNEVAKLCISTLGEAKQILSILNEN
jgi:hypothetical protein